MGISQPSFIPTSIGMLDTIEGTSNVADSMVLPSLSSEPSSRALRMSALPRARKERPDDDIRRVALQRLYELLLTDPAATMIGKIIWKMYNEESDQSAIDQVLSDTFRSKASSTLQVLSSGFRRP